MNISHRQTTNLFSACFFFCTILISTTIPVFSSNTVTSVIKASETQGSQESVFFQNIANQWLSTAFKATTPAVLKGAISMSSSNGYILNPGDTVAISIPKLTINDEDDIVNKSYNAEAIQEIIEVVIRDNGEATIPPFGTFQIAGMTTDSLSKMLEAMSKYYLVNPRVFVTLKSLRPSTIYMLGEINRPGAYATVNAPENAHLAYSGNTLTQKAEQHFYEPRLSLMVAKAGGIKLTSDIQHIRVTNARTQKDITVDLNKLLEGDIEQDVKVEADDVVYIPKCQGEPKFDSMLASSTLSPENNNINVIGYIQKLNSTTNNGSYSISLTLPGNNMTLHRALSGINVDPRANLRKIVVMRKKEDGSLEKHLVNALETDFQLHPNDTIFVPSLRMTANLQQIAQSFFFLTSGIRASVSALE